MSWVWVCTPQGLWHHDPFASDPKTRSEQGASHHLSGRRACGESAWLSLDTPSAKPERKRQSSISASKATIFWSEITAVGLEKLISSHATVERWLLLR